MEDRKEIGDMTMEELQKEVGALRCENSYLRMIKEEYDRVSVAISAIGMLYESVKKK